MTDLLAPPVLSRNKHWQSDQINPNFIGQQLKELWLEIAEERRASNGHLRSIADMASMHTQTINLVVVTEADRDFAEISSLVTTLPDITPSRIVILAAQPGWREALEVGIDVEERQNQPPHAPTRIEVISVRGRGERLASVVTPLLVPDLPDFVWCTTPDYVNDPVLGELADQVDRIVVDSSASPDPSVAFDYLLKLFQMGGSQLQISDMAWTRLHSWRQLIAQFFDQENHLPSLYAAEEVVIKCTRKDQSGRSGVASGLLTAGWLASCMGWRAPGEELVRSRDDWKLTLRAGQKGQSHEVVMLLREVEDEHCAPGLSSITIDAGSPAPGSFSVRRTSKDSMTTLSSTPGAGIAERTIYSANPDASRLLGIELRQFDHDQIFDQALRFAVNLWPEGTPVA
jgi:glucose-6-phosphate dehydrogenase assembly protein OpcA